MLSTAGVPLMALVITRALAMILGMILRLLAAFGREFSR